MSAFDVSVVPATRETIVPSLCNVEASALRLLFPDEASMVLKPFIFSERLALESSVPTLLS